MLVGSLRKRICRLVALRCGAKDTDSRKRCILQTLVSERVSYSAGLRPEGTMRCAKELLDMGRLTADDLHKVNLATIREGVNHCRWPREVIERFLEVEV